MGDPNANALERLESSIRRRLTDNGLTARDSWLFERPSLGIRNGSAIDVLGAEIVYRVTDPQTVLVVLYRRRREHRRSLSNSFAGICWFVAFLKREVSAVRVVSALVDVFPYAKDRGISSDRLADFCTRCGARLKSIDGERWIHLDIGSFVPLRTEGQSASAVSRTPYRSPSISTSSP